MRILQEQKPENIPWNDVGVEYVIESSGKATKKKNAMACVILCNRSSGSVIFVFVLTCPRKHCEGHQNNLENINN